MLEVAEPDRAELLDLGRVTIRAWEWGDPADPPVLLVHGGWDHGRMWDGIAPDIASLGLHVVAVDQRGHGDSSRLHTSNWVAMNLDLAQVATHYGPPVGIVGHSMGGGQSMSVAAAFPELVRWVVNLDGLGPPPEMMRVDDHAAMAAQWLHEAGRVWFEPQREYASVEEMAEKRSTINTRLPLDWCRHLAVHGSKPGPRGGFVWKSDPAMRIGGPGPFGDEFLRHQYGQIACPVSVLTGAEPDQWSDLPDDILAARVAALVDGRHAVADAAGHYIHIERPDAVLDAITELVSEIDGIAA